MFSVEPRRIIEKIEWKCRLISAPFRALPDFLIIGAMKSGTSSLFHYLAQHPQLIPAKKKEVHYFDGGGPIRARSYEKSLNWYRSHFPLRRMIPKEALTYESTPKYLCHPLAARHIYEVRSDMKLILILRNPTERAISHYFHTKTNSSDPKSLHTTMLKEVARFSSEQGPISKNSEIPDYTSYVSRGLYHKQIENYLACFDRHKLFIINSEELFDNPGNIFPGVFEFLGIRTDIVINELAARNVSKRRKHVWPPTRKILDEFFRPHNEDLFTFLGKRYEWQRAS